MPPDVAAPPAPVEEESLRCMEVWGGSSTISRAVKMAGLSAWVYSRPHHASSGGDVYYVSSCATGRITRLLLADVAGHGSAVAELGLALRTLMRRYVNVVNQSQFVNAMNQRFREISNDGIFATALVMTFFAPTRRLSITNAGHPTPLWYRAQVGQWSLLERSVDDDRCRLQNMPLGIIDDVHYCERDIELEPGDLMLCYTDALSESAHPDGRLLGETGLLEVIRTLPDAEPAHVIPALLEKIAALHPGNLNDDVTVLLLGPMEGADQAPLPARFAGLARLVTAIGRSITPGSDAAPWPEISVRNIGGAIVPQLGRRRPPKP